MIATFYLKITVILLATVQEAKTSCARRILGGAQRGWSFCHSAEHDVCVPVLPRHKSQDSSRFVPSSLEAILIPLSLHR